VGNARGRLSGAAAGAALYTGGVTERLIALDWGTSNLRGYLLGGGGRVLATRAAAGGVMAVQDGAFAAALRALCDGWPAGLPLIASGMVGSRQGWREAPYLACPAAPAAAAARLTAVPFEGGVLHIVPGVRYDAADGRADVMRGEETQLWGAALAAGDCCVLPGTHSKWAWIGAGGTIERFATWMTGELYAVLREHSILGRLFEPGPPAPAAFEQGVRLGLAEGAALPHALFSVRTAGLTGALPGSALADHLSGILIGAEVGGALRAGRPARVTLLGEGALCERYAAALALAGVAATAAPADATARGLWRIAVAARLVEEGSE
jgi:2-dehydro-3-deoxygalactonokinase